MKPGWWALIAGVVVIGAVAVVWITRVPQPPDCAFTGWQRTIGIDLDAEVSKLTAVKSVLGITDSQVRDFDTFMKDYALKYDAACQDVRAKPQRMSQAEFTCLRQNMDRVLDQLRGFVQAVDAAKLVQDPGAQRDVVVKALADFNGAYAAHFKQGCASAMNVNPRSLTFAGVVPERSVQITNSGNTAFNYSVDGLPEAFDPKPVSGTLEPGATASVAILRTILPPPDAQPVVFHVRTNMQDDSEIQISYDAQNAALWKNMGDQTKAEAGTAPVTVDHALAVVDRSLQGAKVSEADRYLLASCVLYKINENGAAQSALTTASANSAELKKRPSALILQGLLANRQGDSQKAIQDFETAKNVAPPADVHAQQTAEVLKAAVMLNQGKEEAAKQVLATPTVAEHLKGETALSTFVAKELCKTPGCNAKALVPIRAAK